MKKISIGDLRKNLSIIFTIYMLSNTSTDLMKLNPDNLAWRFFSDTLIDSTLTVVFYAVYPYKLGDKCALMHPIAV